MDGFVGSGAIHAMSSAHLSFLNVKLNKEHNEVFLLANALRRLGAGVERTFLMFSLHLASVSGILVL
ncbi:unnamed protein product [Rodentolepis nana]|uniref:Ovule protein n=1 Tax=Rodentolepis nana TaxID=102285 RepID=A0A0R3TVA0_RODNA|nr:unnamed protein product [Rodentolepis nana]